MLETIAENDSNRETLEMILIHSVERKVSLLSRYLDMRSVLGSTAPLSGHLGTIIGMIKAFDAATIQADRRVEHDIAIQAINVIKLAEANFLILVTERKQEN